MKKDYDKDLLNFGNMCIREKDPLATWIPSRKKYYAMCIGCVVLRGDDLTQLKMEALQYQIGWDEDQIEDRQERIEEAQLRILDAKAIWYQLKQSVVHAGE